MNTQKDQNDIRDTLLTLQNQLYDISKRNPFVDIKKDKLWLFSKGDIDENIVKKIHEKQNYYLKEYGLETTLKIDLFIKWQQPQSEQYYCSPLLFQPAKIKKTQKIDLQYSIEISEKEQWLVNPLIANLFKKHFNFEFQMKYASVDSLKSELRLFFNSERISIVELNHFNDDQEWQLIGQSGVGTFNYQKSILAQNFDSIIKSPSYSVKQILGYDTITKSQPLLGNLNWYPLDNSQREVVAYASSNNLVIQGPPGTGKSHTIVSLLQHYLEQGKKVLFVSEKKSALDVVYKRLGSLQHLAAYFDAEKRPKLSYYKSLKKAYEKAQIYMPHSIPKTDDFALTKSKIYPNNAKLKKESSNVSIYNLESKLIDNTADLKHVDSHSSVPKYSTWEKYSSDLSRIEAVSIKEWKIERLGENLFLNLNKSIFEERNPFEKIEKKIDDLLHKIELIQHIQSEYGLELEWEEFGKICLSASVLSMVNRSQIDLLFENTKSYKSFNTYSKRYQLIKNKLDSIRVQNTAWKIRPSIEKVEAHLLKMEDSGIFSKIRIRKSHQQLFEFYNQSIPVKKGKQILIRLLEEHNLSSKLEEISIKLRHNLNVLNPETDIDFILNIRQKTESISHNYYQQILEHPEHEDLIGVLADQHQIIGHVNRVKSFLFTNSIFGKLNDFKAFLLSFKFQLGFLRHSVNEVMFLLNLPNQIVNFIRLNKYTVIELNRIVLHHELEKELKFEHYLKHLTGSELLRDFENFNRDKKTTFTAIVENIANEKIKAYQDIEKLCMTPHAKLNAEAKASKNYFKKAKRLAVHEMNKTRQLLPVKDLFQSSEQLLTALQPIWMLNPLSIAERLPLKAEIFDVVIFDESSQIPIEDAIPAIHRAKQVVVVGDSNQMPPSQFFGGYNNTKTLLNEAEKVFTSKSLLWHYRSEHPKLISFSNQYFYDNSLKLFPSSNTSTPIEYHYISNGIFANSVNEFEARAIAIRLQELLNDGKNDIAIIAFSKEQEKCIRRHIAKIDLELPPDTVVTNLESVQGIEKETVIISIGYAKKRDGKLNLNFGPINQEQGANRLNVLLSRAISKMEVYTSIKASDLALSDNKGINILRQFLQYAGKKELKNPNKFIDKLEGSVAEFLDEESLQYHYDSELSGMVLSCFSNYSRQNLLLVNPGLFTDDDLDLPVIMSILNQRFKKVKIILNNEWLIDSEKVKKELLAFFK